MRVGYPCINRSVGCTGNHTFRLASYTDARLVETVGQNLDCLERMLEFNRGHGLLGFRISSDLVPFASHPVCRFDWQGRFRDRLRKLGRFARRHRMRVSMHPDQFIVLNSPDRAVFERSRAELRYHAEVLDLMGLELSARIQLHVGGVYGDKPAAIRRFAERFRMLEPATRRRLAVENDDRLFGVADCLEVSQLARVPVVFDSFHHQLNNRGEGVGAALAACARTWLRRDGPPMVDYSSQQPGARPGRHAETIEPKHFRRFLRATRETDFDLMLEIKDKEASALRALRAAARDPRLVTGKEATG
ncbi:UV DNA damage repair endonuclease UvsE [candidate division WOR-3 bacterium]|nr:UV DNA damage repair endonuclease UvsE [candidate division WOR-3 bacterium]